MRFVRRGVLLLLLVGPLVAAELWARKQFDSVYPYLTHYLYWADLKLMMIEKSGCPDVLALGSSVSGRTIVSRHVVGRELVVQGERRAVESVFNFTLNGASASMLYGAWYRIRALGCAPGVVLVEFAPPVVNGYTSWIGYYGPLLDAATLWRLPRRFLTDGPLGFRQLIDSVGVDRLRLYRLRDAYRRAIVEGVGLQPFSGATERVILDGGIDPISEKSLEGPELARERGRRLRSERKGENKYRLSELEVSILAQLIREIGDTGARVVVHTPPMTAMYRNNVGEKLGTRTFAAVGERFRANFEKSTGRNLRWHWCYESTDFGPDLFEDWIHLNRRGGARYVEDLFAALGSESVGLTRCADTPERPN